MSTCRPGILVIFIFMFILSPLFGQIDRHFPWGATKHEIMQLFKPLDFAEEQDGALSIITRTEKDNIPCKALFFFEENRLIEVDLIGLNNYFSVSDCLGEYELLKAELISNFGTDYTVEGTVEGDDVESNLYRVVVWYMEDEQIIGLQIAKGEKGYRFWIMYYEP